MDILEIKNKLAKKATLLYVDDADVLNTTEKKLYWKGKLSNKR